MFPSFTRASSERQSVTDAIAVLNKGKDSESLTKIENELSADGALLSVLEKGVGSTPLSIVIGDLSSMRGPVRLDSFYASRTSTSTISIVIQGISPTRDDLLSFKGRLESRSPGISVDLPISELAKSSNITFSMKVTEPIP